MTDFFNFDFSWLVFSAVILPVMILLAFGNVDNSWHKIMDKHLQASLLIVKKSIWLPLVRIVFLLLLCLCLIQPSQINYIQAQPCGIIALDVTPSMNQIMPSGLTKLQQAKISLEQWIDIQPNYLLNLWIWAEDSYKLVPLTTDRSFIKSSLDWVQTDLLNHRKVNAVQSMQRINQQIPSKCKQVQWLIISDGIPNHQWLSLQASFDTVQNIIVVDLSSQGKLSNQIKAAAVNPNIVTITNDHTFENEQATLLAQIENSQNLHPSIPFGLIICTLLWLLIGIGEKSSAAPLFSKTIYRLLLKELKSSTPNK